MEFRPIKESDLGSTYDIRFSVTENRILPHQIHLLERDRVLEQLRSGFGVLAIEGDAAVGYCTAAGRRPRQRVVANRPEALPRRPAPIARTSALAAAAPMAARSRPRGCVTCKAPSAERRSPSETSCASARTGRRAPFGRFSAFAAHRQAGRRH